MKLGPCIKCGSTEVLRDVRLMDRGDGNMDVGDLSLVVYKKPEAWLFKNPALSALSACVCTECGYTELYATKPQALAQAVDAAARATGRDTTIDDSN